MCIDINTASLTPPVTTHKWSFSVSYDRRLIKGTASLTNSAV